MNHRCPTFGPTRLVIALALILAACHPKDDDGAPALLSSAPATPATTEPSAAAPSSSAADDAAEEAAFAAPAGSALVALDGSSRPLPELDASVPKIAAKALVVPVHLKPSNDARKIGYLRAGAIVEADASDAGRDGCPGGWRAIKPAGYVCLGDKATADLDDPIVRATTRRPDHTQKLPYMYGIVTRGGPAYARIPTADELKETEPGLAKHIAKWRADETSGADYGLDLWFKWKKDKPSLTAWEAWEQKVTDPELPPYLQDGATIPDLSGLVKKGSLKIDQIDRRQGHAFIDSFLVDGRRWNVTTDLRVVPADRYRPIRGSDYHGVRIGTDVKLPFVLIRRQGAKKWTWSASKKKMVEGDALE
ncbi:MAG TPA: L,D-transpeptidase, partial [Polyangiaceae bacterium]|nr:L,D-transpeptidase [Polyangiaceae bacterium]